MKRGAIHLAATRSAYYFLKGSHGIRLLDTLRRCRGKHYGDTRSHLTDKGGARPGGKGPQRSSFHQSAIRFPLLSVSSSALRSATRYRSTSSGLSSTPWAPGTVIVFTETVCFTGVGSGSSG